MLMMMMMMRLLMVMICKQVTHDKSTHHDLLVTWRRRQFIYGANTGVFMRSR